MKCYFYFLDLYQSTMLIQTSRNTRFNIWNKLINLLNISLWKKLKHEYKSCGWDVSSDLLSLSFQSSNVSDSNHLIMLI